MWERPSFVETTAMCNAHSLRGGTERGFVFPFVPFPCTLIRPQPDEWGARLRATKTRMWVRAAIVAASAAAAVAVVTGRGGPACLSFTVQYSKCLLSM